MEKGIALEEVDHNSHLVTCAPAIYHADVKKYTCCQT